MASENDRTGSLMGTVIVGGLLGYFVVYKAWPYLKPFLAKLFGH